MQKTKQLTTAFTLATSLLLPAQALATEKLPVVATFSVLGDMVAQVGGDHVEVTTLIGANGDAHVYSPRPADVRAFKEAKLLIANGLGFESWLERLTQSANFRGKTIVATQGIRPLTFDEETAHTGHDEGHHHHHHHHDHHPEHDAFDPHAWHDITNARIYVNNIAQALAEVDPEHASTYRDNAKDYTQKLEQLDLEIRQAMAAIPVEQRKLVTPHDSFGYLAQAYELEFLAPQSGSTESEASAADVARLIRQIREQNIRAIFVENTSDPRLVEQISRETAAKVGGKLYSDALSDPNEPAATYYGMMRHNAFTIVEALTR